MTAPASGTRALLMAIALAVVVAVLGKIPLAGIDHVLLADYEWESFTLAYGLIWVVVARGALSIIGWRESALVALIPAGLGGWYVASSLSEIQFAGEFVVADPGWSFHLFTVLTLTAATAVGWFGVAAITRTGRISGGACLGAILAMPALGAVTDQVVASPAMGTSVWGVLPLLGYLFPTIVLGSIVALRGMPQGPVIGSARVRSLLDAPALGLLISHVAHWLTPLSFPVWSGPLLAMATTAVVGVALYRSEERASPSPLLHLVGPLVAGLLLVRGILPNMVGLIETTKPGPFQGSASFVAELSSTDPTATQDGPGMVHRLKDLGVEASWTSPSSTRLVLDVSGASSPSVVDAVRHVEAFEIRSPHGRIDFTGVAFASVAWSPYTHAPTVNVKLTPKGTADFCDITTKSVDQVVEVVVDGVVLMAPVVREPICGGALVVEMGSVSDALERATALAAALNHVPLAAPWTLDRVR